MADLDDQEVIAALSRAPRVPGDPSLFSADSAFAGPGIYDGPPMRPAAGPPASEEEARLQLVASALDREAAEACYADHALISKVPDAGVRAALALLSGTVAEVAIRLVVESESLDLLAYGSPSGSGRIVGQGTSGRERFVNARYRSEQIVLLSGPIAHEILCSPTPRCDAEEKFTHAVLAMVHMQLLARSPDLVAGGTELSRRLNSITLSLFNSRQPGEPRFSMLAPQGAGTVPGGRPAMQTPDFWSIPFGTGHPDPVDMPEPLSEVLAALGCDLDRFDGSPAYDLATVAWIDSEIDLEWLGWRERGIVGRALGVL